MERDENSQPEIIIVRRGKNGHEDDHHGGVWKIAFADFMTAMMAFFLVMWLVNASNEKTKKAVASYFNPIKLTDTTTNSKGIKNPKYGIDSDDQTKNEDVTTIEPPAKIEIKLSTHEQKFDEQALFVDPYSILAEIEGGVGQDDGADKKFNSTDPGDGSSLNKGVSFQDPFDPNSWDARRELTPQEHSEEIIDGVASAGADGDSTGLMNSEENDFSEVDAGDLNEEQPKEVEPAEEQVAALDQNRDDALNSSGAGEGAKANIDGDQNAGIADQDQSPGKAENGVADGELERKIAEATSEIKEQLKAALTESNLTGLDVEVTSSSDGVVVVLSDNNRNGMFTIGSARPTPELVKTMAKLGGVIGQQKGNVEISGHTDGRKYQSGDYDNWRLSTSRAHMAYYMLVRGGMEEKRVERIVGQADVNLKFPGDPNAAANRRIEVTIKPL